MSGDHGAVSIQGAYGRRLPWTPNLAGFDNADVITIEAFLGQTPVIRKLKLIGGSGWVLRGLTFQSENHTGIVAMGAS